jgi:sugar phosphate isomerase/epimerase
MSTQQPQLGAAMDVRFGISVESFLEYITDLGLSHLELKREYLEGFPDTPTPATLGALTDRYDVSLTYHAPFRDWNMGSFNDAIRRNSAARVKQTLDDAAAAEAGGVVVHAGSVPRRYPEWVREKAHNNACKSLRECAVYADRVGVPLCVENQPISDRDIRHTTTVADLASAVSIDGTDACMSIKNSLRNLVIKSESVICMIMMGRATNMNLSAIMISLSRRFQQITLSSK